MLCNWILSILSEDWSYGAMEQFIDTPPSSETSELFCRSGRLLILWSTTCNLPGWRNHVRVNMLFRCEVARSARFFLQSRCLQTCDNLWGCDECSRPGVTNAAVQCLVTNAAVQCRSGVTNAAVQCLWSVYVYVCFANAHACTYRTFPTLFPSTAMTTWESKSSSTDAWTHVFEELRSSLLIHHLHQRHQNAFSDPAGCSA